MSLKTEWKGIQRVTHICLEKIVKEDTESDSNAIAVKVKENRSCQLIQLAVQWPRTS